MEAAPGCRAGIMEVAAHFTSEKLSYWVGRQIIGVEVYIPVLGDREITVSVYDSGTLAPGVMLREKSDTVDYGWSTVYFATPLTIYSGDDLWVAYRTYADSPDLEPIGVDAGPGDPNGHFWHAYPSGPWYVSSGTNYIIRAVLN